MTGVRPRVRIVVDEVVLRGLTPAQAGAVVAGLERTLGALAGGARADAFGLPGTDPAAVPAGPAPVLRPRMPRAPAPSAAALGAQAAAALWSAVGAVGGAR